MSYWISSISSANPAVNSSCSTIELTAATKAKLEALGVDTKNITTEIQGQKILKTAQAKQKVVQQAQESCKSASECSIKSEAKDLASDLGVSVSDYDTFDEILGKISSAISKLKSSAGDDEIKLAQVEKYQSQYDAIAGNYSSMQTAQAQLSGSMSSLSNYNKIYLNLI